MGKLRFEEILNYSQRFETVHPCFTIVREEELVQTSIYQLEVWNGRSAPSSLTPFQGNVSLPYASNSSSDAQTLRRMDALVPLSGQELANIFGGGEGRGYEKKWETIR